MSIQGEAIRDLDVNNPHGRKANRPDSDDEDNPSNSTMNGRSMMNIYIERQKKRVKLSATNPVDPSLSSMLT